MGIADGDADMFGDAGMVGDADAEDADGAEGAAAGEVADGIAVGAASASGGAPAPPGDLCAPDARAVGSWSSMRFSILFFAGRRHLRSHKNRHRLLWT
ncbi:hypothetical protein [Bifidobacterium italicum]|uniref:hypothetical protein n=1 Tax=Bifidobacterium italicum TaxID=1960968 RepID=UPI0012FFAE64|nr:hypothetical protein [Bifidobacterium italicum]